MLDPNTLGSRRYLPGVMKDRQTQGKPSTRSSVSSVPTARSERAIRQPKREPAIIVQAQPAMSDD